MLPCFLLGLSAALACQAPPAAKGPTVVVRGRVVDDTTGRPVPCRVTIRGRDGSWHFAESASPEGSAVAYRKTAINNPGVVEMHVTLSAHPFIVKLPPG